MGNSVHLYVWFRGYYELLLSGYYYLIIIINNACWNICRFVFHNSDGLWGITTVIFLCTFKKVWKSLFNRELLCCILHTALPVIKLWIILSQLALLIIDTIFKHLLTISYSHPVDHLICNIKVKYRKCSNEVGMSCKT